MLDAAEEALDAISLSVEGLVVGVLALAVTPWRDDRITALVDDEIVEALGVIGLVGQDVVGRQAFDQITGRGHVVLLAGAGDEADRQAERVYADVELGSETAARAAKRLGVRSPLFRRAPAAWA